jgi:hypothetical protein
MIDEKANRFDKTGKIQFLEESQPGADLLRVRDSHRGGTVSRNRSKHGPLVQRICATPSRR